MSHSSEHAAPFNSAKLLLPLVILGMLVLTTIMYKFGGNAGVVEYQDRAATHQSADGHGH